MPNDSIPTIEEIAAQLAQAIRDCDDCHDPDCAVALDEALLAYDKYRRRRAK